VTSGLDSPLRIEKENEGYIGDAHFYTSPQKISYVKPVSFLSEILIPFRKSDTNPNGNITSFIKKFFLQAKETLM